MVRLNDVRHDLRTSTYREAECRRLLEAFSHTHQRPPPHIWHTKKSCRPVQAQFSCGRRRSTTPWSNRKPSHGFFTSSAQLLTTMTQLSTSNRAVRKVCTFTVVCTFACSSKECKHQTITSGSTLAVAIRRPANTAKLSASFFLEVDRQVFQKKTPKTNTCPHALYPEKP